MAGLDYAMNSKTQKRLPARSTFIRHSLRAAGPISASRLWAAILFKKLTPRHGGLMPEIGRLKNRARNLGAVIKKPAY